MREGGGVGLGIAGAIVAFFALLPGVLVVAVYVFLSVYGIVKGSDFRSPGVDVGLVLAGIAAIVSLLTVALAGGIAAIGRSLAPPQDRHDRARA